MHPRPTDALMTAHVTRCALLALLMLGCTESHAPAPGASCTLDDGAAPCPDGMYCALHSHRTGERECRVLCGDGILGGAARRRCDTGEACTRMFEEPPADDPTTCWLGGPGAEGDACRHSSHCARGLWCAEDLSTADETAARCAPVCDDDDDCRAGEECISQAYCAVPCDPAVPCTCAEGSVCVTGFCLWNPRAADCNRDDVSDCPLGQICAARTPGAIECWDPVDYPYQRWPWAFIDPPAP